MTLRTKKAPRVGQIRATVMVDEADDQPFTPSDDGEWDDTEQMLIDACVTVFCAT